jgi:ATP/maltotriose-dependent transcriptional regulator MalT
LQLGLQFDDVLVRPGKTRQLVTRHDVRLGLHRLRLTGELAEIRDPDLRFTVAEARELFTSAGCSCRRRR